MDDTNHPKFSSTFYSGLSSYWGTPMAMETSIFDEDMSD